MKKRLVVLLIIVLYLFIFCEKVWAFDGGSLSKYGTGITAYHYKDYYEMSAYSIGGQSAFCRNPNKAAYPGTWFGCSQLAIRSGDIYWDSYNYGVLTILNNGGTNGGNHVATTLALRVYESFWPSYNTTECYYSGSLSNELANIQHSDTQRHSWDFFNDWSIQSIMNQVKQNSWQSLTDAYWSRSYCFQGRMSTYFSSSWVVSYAKDLVRAGLNAALKVQRDGGLSSVKLANPYVQIKAVKLVNNQQVYTKLVTYTADLTKMGNATNVPFRFTCKDCAQRGVSYKITINNKQVTGFVDNSTINFRNYVTSEKKVLVTIEFTSKTNYKNCQEIHYELEFGSVSDINEFGYNCSAGWSYQQFYVLDRSQSSGTVSNTGSKKEGKLRLCEPTCKKLEASCNNNRGPEEDCKDFNDKYKGKCIICTSTMNNPMCKYGDTNLTINEGYEQLENKCANPTKQNIKYCIINNKDKLGNTYQATDIMSTENKYCSVWCKENYDIKLPGQQNVTSGRYFTLKADISGTKTCYTDNINVTEFESDLNDVTDELQKAYSDWLADKSVQNSSLLNTLNNRLKQIVNQYKACSSWNMDFKFDPKIEFYYEEEYMNYVTKNTFDTFGNIKKSDIKVQRCEKEASDDGYNNCPSGWKESLPTIDKNIFTCTFDNGEYTCNNQVIKIPQVINMKESMNISATYKSPTQFFTIYPNGTIVSAQNNSTIENGSGLENALPVGLGTTQGLYKYVLKVKDLGEYYDYFGIGNGLGRILGTDNNIVSNLLSEKSDCGVNECLKKSYDIDSKHFDNGLYVCKYAVNIDTCKTEKDGYCNPNCPNDLDCPKTCTEKDNKFYCLSGEECTQAQYNAQCCDHCLPTVSYNCMMSIENGQIVYYNKSGSKVNSKALYAADCCSNGHCQGACKYCLYDNNNLNLSFRQITSEDINPNNRELGINWQYDEKDLNKNYGLSLKAYQTTKEIMEDGDNIYDMDFENTNDNNDFAMKVDMDSKMITSIREYNKNNAGVYNEDTLSCYDYDKDGIVYEKIYCYSKFLDYLLDKPDLNNKIKFSVDRPTTENERKNTGNSKYWTIWTDFTLTDNTNIGPSWK